MESTSQTTPTPADGILDEIGGRTVLRFERRFPHPVERVWAALTEPAQMGKWLCGTSEVDLELVEGGRFAFRITGPSELLALIGDGGLEADWVVRRVEPPLVFEHSFLDDPETFVRYELQRDGVGCRLYLTAGVPSRELAVEGQFLVGFHMSLEALEQVLDGRPSPWTQRRFDELRDGYALKEV